MTHLTDDAVMLYLAGLSYRGFGDLRIGRPHTDALRRSISHGLDALAPAIGRWEVAWGPAVYRASLSALDDAAMYVAHSRDKPGRYVVVIRGTNPTSAFDWVFGDFWAGRQVPWRYGANDERISLSTALGLSLLQGMRSDGPRDDARAALWKILDRRTAHLAEAKKGLTHAVASIAGPLIEDLRTHFTGLVQAIRRPVRQLGEDNVYLVALQAFWTSQVRAAIIEATARASALFDGRLDLAVLGLLQDEAQLRASLGEGSDVLTFLAGVMQSTADPVDIVVTGHSKGGALASTFALWLAEIQGRAGGDEEWDPDRRATISCYSFAGPTAGNDRFAARSNELIGKRCHRIVNRLDVVPHAWALADLAAIADLYDHAQVAPLPALGGLTAAIVGATGSFKYCHIGLHVTELPGQIAPTAPFFFDQFVHQHMQEYLIRLGLVDAGVDTATLFAGI